MYTQVGGKCISKRNGNLGQNAESENAMSRGTLRLEWQYTLGLIIRNYRLLNLDIRHMCAFNQTARIGHNLCFLFPVSIHKLYSPLNSRPPIAHVDICHYKLGDVIPSFGNNDQRLVSSLIVIIVREMMTQKWSSFVTA